MNIFVGNLSFDAGVPDLLEAFRNFGQVSSAVIVMDKNGKKSRGFGFVEMADDEQARAAILALDGKKILGRQINVMPATGKGPAISLKRTGKYKQGRRTISFLKKRMARGLTSPVIEKKPKVNPMSWIKKPQNRFNNAKRKPS